jgi:hypothetical protein
MNLRQMARRAKIKTIDPHISDCFLPRRGLQFGHFKTSLGSINRFFLRKLRETQDCGLKAPARMRHGGHMRVARRFIAGSGTTWDMRPGGMPEDRRAISLQKTDILPGSS